MADTPVILTHVATDAYENLPPWATENTLGKIQGILQKTYNLQAKALAQLIKKASTGPAGQNQEAIKKYNDELGKAFRNLKKENEEAPKKRKERKEVEDHHK